jgi:hypothetical protein
MLSGVVAARACMALESASSAASAPGCRRRLLQERDAVALVLHRFRAA